jgi:hypothetical protein
LGPKTIDCVFLGYTHNSAAYRFLVIKSEFSDVHVNTLTESRDATFFKEIFPMKDRVAIPNEASTSSVPQPIPFSLPHVHSEQPTEDYSIDAPRRSKRQRTEKSFGDDFTVYLVDDTPKTLSGAYASPDVEYWKEAVRNEMDSILINGTWEICDLPVGCKPVGCKWIFKKKMKPNGTVDKFKARLVVRDLPKKKARIILILIHLLLG